MALLMSATQAPHLGGFVAAALFGVLIAIAGHLFRSRTLVITGLLVIAAVVVYFSFVLQPSGG
jgi:hypothetical protein